MLEGWESVVVVVAALERGCVGGDGRRVQCVGQWWENWKPETRRRGNSKRVNACAILLEHAMARLCMAVCTRLSRVSQLPVSPVESFRAY